MYKHYKKLIGFEFIPLTKEQYEHEKAEQLKLFGNASVMVEKITDTIILLPVENLMHISIRP